VITEHPLSEGDGLTARTPITAQPLFEFAATTAEEAGRRIGSVYVTLVSTLFVRRRLVAEACGRVRGTMVSDPEIGDPLQVVSAAAMSCVRAGQPQGVMLSVGDRGVPG
jgi:hypothetical protein